MQKDNDTLRKACIHADLRASCALPRLVMWKTCGSAFTGIFFHFDRLDSDN